MSGTGAGKARTLYEAMRARAAVIVATSAAILVGTGAVIGAVVLHRTETAVQELITDQAISQAESGIMWQDHYAIQRELTRTVTALRQAQRYSVNVQIDINGRLVAAHESIPADSWKGLWKRLEHSQTTASGDTVSVSVVFARDSIVEAGLYGLAVILALVMLQSLLLRHLVDRFARGLSGPISETIASLRTITSSLDRPVRPTVRRGPGTVDEIHSLDRSIAELVEGIERYHAEIAAGHEQTLAAERRAATYEAIARTTQMLAHDVRRPFSYLRIGLQMLRTEIKRGSSTSDLERVCDRVGAEIDTSLGAVNTMLADIVELGRGRRLDLAAVDATAMLAAATREVMDLRARPAEDVVVDCRHTGRILADVDRLPRVLHNLLDNALDAAGASGQVKVGTADRTDGERALVEIHVWNSGAFIEASEVGKVFDAFYTWGKAHGTGLGLAIAREIVTAHGGEITCVSSAAEGTRFTLTIPKAP